MHIYATLLDKFVINTGTIITLLDNFVINTGTIIVRIFLIIFLFQPQRLLTIANVKVKVKLIRYGEL